MTMSSSSGTNSSAGNRTTGPSLSDQRYYEEHIAAYIGFGIVIIALVANSINAAAYYRDVRLQVVFNFYTFHLALADIGYCVLVIVKISYSWLHAFTLYNSVVLCMTLTFACVTMTLHQLALLHMMTFDRRRAVKRGLTYRRKQTKFGNWRTSTIPSQTRASFATRSIRFSQDGTSSVSKSIPSIKTVASSHSDRTLQSQHMSGGGLSRDVRSSRATISAFTAHMAPERVKVYSSWMVSAVVGFLVTDVSFAHYVEEQKKCMFPIRFLYVHNTSYIHMGLLCTLLISFLAIVKEYWKQKQRRPSRTSSNGCCRCLGKSNRPGQPKDYHSRLSFAALSRTSSAILVPRSPIQSSAHPLTGRDWFSVAEEDLVEGSDYSHGTSIDTYHDDKQHNHVVAVDHTALPSPGARRFTFNRPVLTFLPKPDSEKAGLLALDENELETELSPSLKRKAGNTTHKFERRFHLSPGHRSVGANAGEVLSSKGDKHLTKPITAFTIARDQNDDIDKDVEFEFTEDGLEAHVIPRLNSTTGTVVGCKEVISSSSFPYENKESPVESKYPDGMIHDRREKSEMRKIPRVFNSIDKYCQDSVTKQTVREERRVKSVEAEVSIDTIDAAAFDIFVGENNDGPGNFSHDNSLHVLPALSFSDDEVSEITKATFNKVRTDSLYTLRSCLSIPEEGVPVDGDLLHRELVSHSAVGSDSETAMSRRPPPISLPKGREDTAISAGVNSANHRKLGNEGPKSALFTIGDGDEDTEEGDLEDVYQGWDNLFGGITGCKKQVCPGERHQQDNDFLLLQPDPFTKHASLSEKSVHIALKDKRLTPDEAANQQGSPIAKSLELTRRELSPFDSNENRNDPPEQSSLLVAQPTTSQQKTNTIIEKCAVTPLRRGVKKRPRRMSSSSGGMFSRLGEKTALKYRLMLRDWTSQGIYKDREKSALTPSTCDATRSLETWMEFYYTHCSHNREDMAPRGSVLEAGSTEDTSFASQSAVSNGSERVVYPIPETQNSSSTRSDQRRGGVTLFSDELPFQTPAEVEEDADNEDGLLTAQKKSEIDAAVGQWLTFYEVCQPSRRQSQLGGLASSQFSTPDMESLTIGSAMPELHAIGDVSHVDLLKARQIWFQFYNIKSQAQVRSPSCEKTPSYYEVFPSTMREASAPRHTEVEYKEQVNQEYSSVTNNACGVDLVTSRPASNDNLVCSQVYGTLCPNNDLTRPNSERGFNESLPTVLTRTQTSDDLVHKLFTKLSAISPDSQRCYYLHEGEEREMTPVKSDDVRINTSRAQELTGVDRKLSDPSMSHSLGTWSISQGNGLSEIMSSNPNPSLTSSESVANALSSSVDPILAKCKEPGWRICSQSDKLRRKARKEQSLAYRVPDVTPSPRLSSSRLESSSQSSVLNQRDIQVCPPCSPVSLRVTSESESTPHSHGHQFEINMNQTTAQVHSEPSRAKGSRWTPFASDLAYRLIESVSLQRRALLAELGLYHDLLTGLIPVDWMLSRRASNTERPPQDEESGAAGQSQAPEQPMHEIDPEECSECPYCLRRIQEKHAHMGKQVEANFRRLFGMRSPAFSDTDESSSEEEFETDNDTSSKPQAVRGQGDKSGGAQDAANREKWIKHTKDGAGHSSQANHDSLGRARGGQSGTPQGTTLGISHGAVANSNFNNFKLPSLSLSSVPSVDKLSPSQNDQPHEKSSSGSGEVATTPVMKKRPWGIFGRASFQAILLKDPLLALVLSHALILGTQFSCWLPRTLLYVYYDLTGFPILQSRTEIMTTVLWYARLIMTPCVYLYYSRGFRENFTQLLLKPLGRFRGRKSQA